MRKDALGIIPKKDFGAVQSGFDLKRRAKKFEAHVETMSVPKEIFVRCIVADLATWRGALRVSGVWRG